MSAALSPYAVALGLSVARDEDGPVLALPFTQRVVGRPGFLHGGAIAGLLEAAAYAALHEALDGASTPIGVKPVTVTIDYMRGGRDRETRASASIVRLGTNIANVAAIAWQRGRDAPIAGARLTFLLDRVVDEGALDEGEAAG